MEDNPQSNSQNTSQSLEEVIREIVRLREDLSATIPTGRFFDPDVDGYGSSQSDASIGRMITRGRVEITEPDEETRGRARKQLNEIKDNSTFYSIKYLVGNALGRVNDEELNSWLSDLEKLSLGNDSKISAVQDAVKLYESLTFEPSYLKHHKEEEKLRIWLENLFFSDEECSKIVAKTVYNNTEDMEHMKLAGQKLGLAEPIIVIGQLRKGFNVSNDKIRESYENPTLDSKDRIYAGQRLGIQKVDIYLHEANLGKELTRDMWNEIYCNAENQQDRRIAGKALGYSNLRIWTDEHSNVLQASLFALGASGLGYLIYKILTD